MYRGVEAPVIVWKNTVINLPKPKKGSRKERFKSLGKIYENIDAELIPGERKYRFEGEYEFGKMTQNVLETIIDIHNKTAIVKWVPHSEFPIIKYDVLIKEMTPDTLEGIIQLDRIKIKVVSKYPVFKIPSIDNMIMGFQFTNIGVIKE